MKTLFTFLLTSLMAVSVMAADVASRITVSFSGHRNYEVLIDSRSYGYGNNRILLNNIRPGRHTVEVYDARSNKRNKRAVYATSFTVRPQYDLDIQVDRNGRVQLDESRNSSRNNRDWDRRDDRNENDRYDRRYNEKNWNDRDTRNWNDRQVDNKNYNPGWEQHNYNKALSDYDFNQLTERIRRQWFGSAQYNTAKEGVENNYFTTLQVRQLLQLFAADSERLALSRLAYSHTVDPRNYTQLYDLLSRSAQAELDRYTRDRRY